MNDESILEKQAEEAHVNKINSLTQDGLGKLYHLEHHQIYNLNMACGICCEVGELIEAMKIPVDVDDLIEKCGDIEFYLCGLRLSTGIQVSSRFPFELMLGEAIKERLVTSSANILNMIQRNFFNDEKLQQEVDQKAKTLGLRSHIVILDDILFTICKRYGFTRRQVLEVNTAKHDL